MKLIHTSDWHLGQVLRGHPRHAEHAVFLAWLADTLAARRADALLLAGDVFDQANPDTQALRLFFSFVADVHRRLPHLRTVIISGNHDSAARLDALAPVLQPLGVHVVGALDARAPMDSAAAARVCVPLPGPDGGTAAWVLAIPFLRPGEVARASAPAPSGDAVRRTYRETVDAALALRRPGQPILALGHLHARGATISPDSERPIILGGEDAVDTASFPAELAYVALGHLHLSQRVGTDHVRYAGSPIPLSFPERDYVHQVLEVTTRGEHLAHVEGIPVPRPAPILRFPAQPAPLEDVLLQLAALPLPSASPGLETLLEVQLLADTVPTDLRHRVDEALRGRPVRLAGITRVSSTPRAPLQLPGGAASTRDLAPETVLLKKLEADQVPATPDLLAAFQELLRDVRQEGG